ncbi:hypothetical protein Ahy_B01g056485 isoform C [Arachis hypogaea]|uniref:Uncharacterized protein n=1 Tax=Arachis hypogaea TaxID=3818 RepID=A0A445AYZ6_ARAHY|nr:hypothetical protein Ahy_B01g056485 isoform C [Arachis hypogaea]
MRHHSTSPFFSQPAMSHENSVIPQDDVIMVHLCTRRHEMVQRSVLACYSPECMSSFNSDGFVLCLFSLLKFSLISLFYRFGCIKSKELSQAQFPPSLSVAECPTRK